MNDPVVYDTNRYHTQLEKEAERFDDAEKRAIKMVGRAEFGRQEIQNALYLLTTVKDKHMARSLADEDYIEFGRLVRELLIAQLVEEILDNDY